MELRTVSIEALDRAVDWRWLPDAAAYTLEQGLDIQAISAPTFAEVERARWVEKMFSTVGLTDVTTDNLHNVYGRLKGHSALPGVMISAHTDTIFSAETNLASRRQGDLIYAPGLGDNSMGVAGILALIECLRYANIPLERDLWFAATTREEGLGDLGGMRAEYDRLYEHIDCVVNLEGLAFGYVYHAGIAVRRLHITVQTPGGHSWLHFGRPSAVHSLLQTGARIAALQPQSPRTTFNIGMIEGGEAINAIATHAGLWLDLRSESREHLMELEAQVRRQIRPETPEVVYDIAVVGDRPAGAIATDHPLVEAAMRALAQVGTRGALEVGSTDGNIPLSQGCPAVTIGITRGGNAHRLDEYIEISPITPGIHQLTLLALHLASS